MEPGGAKGYHLKVRDDMACARYLIGSLLMPGAKPCTDGLVSSWRGVDLTETSIKWMPIRIKMWARPTSWVLRHIHPSS